MLELADRVTLYVDDELDRAFPARHGARVSVVTHDGQSFSAEVGAARGTPANPLSREDIIRKFRSITSSVLHDRVATEIDGPQILENNLSEISKGFWPPYGHTCIH